MTNNTLIKSLQNADLYSHPVKDFSVLETHCSWVILTGHYAYKIKKAVDFGFLNYSSLEKRKHYCIEEVKRNQALAKQIYLEAIPIYGNEKQPNFTGTGEVIEYAVKMHEFSQIGLLSHLQAKQQLNNTIIDKLAENLASFHLQAPQVPTNSPIGSSEHAQQQTRDNFTQTLPLLEKEEDKQELQQLFDKVEKLYQKIKPIIDRRKTNGSVRQCHGDVHLNNITLIDGNPIIFDCIDFNNDFCWTDTMADLGFITMDLDEFGEPNFSWRLLNHYLQVSGDYDGLYVLPYFQAYRAMVRAKVAMFSLIHSTSIEHKAQHYQRYKGCVALTKSYLQPKAQKLLITCGVSASGKSTVVNQLAPLLKLITITSDRERKRQANINLQENCTAPVLTGLYHPEQTEKTYQSLLEISKNVLNAGYAVILDATFREQKYRQLLANLAKKISIPFFILYCHAPEKQLRQWLKERKTTISEATQDVLSMQLQSFESPLLNESKQTIDIFTAATLPIAEIVKQIKTSSDYTEKSYNEPTEFFQKTI